MNQPALLLVDVQIGIDDPSCGRRNNPDSDRVIERLLNTWRSAELPVVHVRHASTETDSPLRPERPGFEYKDVARPVDGEPEFVKSVNSAFIGTNLESHLREHDLLALVVAGYTTDHCVSTTVRMAGNLGFSVRLVADATAAFDKTDANGDLHAAENIHAVHLASLHGEFCSVVTSAQVLASVSTA